MVLIVKEKASGDIHQVVKFLGTQKGEQCIWSLTWRGRHIIGEDAEWVDMTDQEWEYITFIKQNPELTMRQIAKEIHISYRRVFHLVKCHNLKVKLERVRGDLKQEQYWKKYCVPK